MDKRRQPLVVEDSHGNLLAMGVLYNDGNVQIFWRRSLGWTGEQWNGLQNLLWIEGGATTLRLVPELPTLN